MLLEALSAMVSNAKINLPRLWRHHKASRAPAGVAQIEIRLPEPPAMDKSIAISQPSE